MQRHISLIFHNILYFVYNIYFIRRLFGRYRVSILDVTGVPRGRDTYRPKNSSFKVYHILKEWKLFLNINFTGIIELYSTFTGSKIWRISFKNWIIYDLSLIEILKLLEFVWVLHSSVWVVFKPFLPIDATDRSKISSDYQRIRSDVSPTPPFIFREHSL